MNMRPDNLADLRLSLTQQLDATQLHWWLQAHAKLEEQPHASTAALLCGPVSYTHLTLPTSDLV